MTEKDIKFLLAKKYSAPAFAFFTNVGNSTGFANRWADAVAFSLYPSTGFQIEGFEIKISRQDFLNEMRNPAKACEIMENCDRWYLVAPKGVARVDELPKTWGFYEIIGGRFYKRKAAPQLPNDGINLNFIAALLRRATEDVVPKEFLRGERKEMEETIRAELKEECDREKRNFQSLEKKVKDFEENSGVTIDTWDGSVKIGLAVKFVLEGGLSDFVYGIRRIRDSLKDVNAAIPQMEEIINIAEEQRKKMRIAVGKTIEE